MHVPCDKKCIKLKWSSNSLSNEYVDDIAVSKLNYLTAPLTLIIEDMTKVKNHCEAKLGLRWDTEMSARTI